MRLPLTFVCLSLAAFARAQDAQKPTSTIVDLGYAQYQGTLNAHGNIDFLGMRFAAAPTGSLRWREPQLPQFTPGVQQANAFPNRCFEAGQGNQAVASFPLRSHGGQQPNQAKRAGLEKRAVPGFSEDCLFLNVITPANAKNLPVVVWIHGGGYMAGSASGFSGTDVFDGNDLVREAGEGAVAVIIQYRLGTFGFLAGQQIHDNGALNAGLLDQQFALQWVQRHIKKFGGDPDKVTIWGESAGAGSVLQHIVANNGNTHPPLFRGAITSSTFLPSQYPFNHRIPEQLFAQIANASGCGSAKNALDCLRQADVNLIQAANGNVGNGGFFGTFLFVPVIDGRLITKRPTQLIQEGRVNGKALLSVTNTFEGALFVDPKIESTVHIPTYLANLFPDFGDAEVAQGTLVYAQDGTPFDQAIGIMGESIFICPTYFLLRAFKNKSFKGEFAIPPGGHGNDVAYYFPGGGPPPFNNPQFLTNFGESFLNFVRDLDTNKKWDPANTTPQWAKWSDKQGRVEMLFNKTDAGAPVFHTITTSSDLLDKRCAFWERVSALTAQ